MQYNFSIMILPPTTVFVQVQPFSAVVFLALTGEAARTDSPHSHLNPFYVCNVCLLDADINSLAAQQLNGHKPSI